MVAGFTLMVMLMAVIHLTIRVAGWLVVLGYACKGKIKSVCKQKKKNDVKINKIKRNCLKGLHRRNYRITKSSYDDGCG